MKIYLAGSMAGGREFERSLKLICKILKEMGHVVMTEKNVIKMLPKYVDGLNLRARRNIMRHDKRWLRNSDVFIAEVSTYSHGVGYEHAYAESLGKPVLLLRHKSLKGKSYSAFLDGTDCKEFMFSFYDRENIKRVLKRFFAKYVRA